MVMRYAAVADMTQRDDGADDDDGSCSYINVPSLTARMNHFYIYLSRIYKMHISSTKKLAAIWK